ncbi:hypothetical protein A5719_26385 [Mycolicibacterium peregrinum]|uniref:hypothetical protein n=1 Tax=Mycolicibacterium peregrinum TaxID=43304 RepID=UPI0007EA1050|nr:hypothetical protein [Mycolicibacterium peregrinum]OBF34421.1 hypothetical protein A5719_26385 [Mycolicibacterium peregrinum]
MQVAARPYLAAGVALFGASAIAMSPIAPPMPDIAVPAVSSAAVSLSAATDPIQAYADLFANTIANVSALIGTEVTDPAPVLLQVITNQLTTAGSLFTALQGSATALGNALDPSNPWSIPSLLQASLTDLLAGNINGAVSNLWSAFLTPVAGAVLPLLEPAINAIRQPVQNLANVLSNPAIVALPALGLLNVAYRTVTVAGNVGQDIVDSATAGDALRVVNAMLGGPAVVADAFLNGDALGGGVFGPSLGLLSTLRQARELIAAAITPPAADAAITPPAADAARTAADATLTSAAKVVTLDVSPKAAVVSPAPAAAPVEAAPVVAAPAETETAAGDSAATKSPSSASTPVVKDSLKAEPGKALSTNRSGSAKQVREGLQGSVKSVTDGLKKATEGLSGKSAKAGKHRAANSGGGSSSSGSGDAS